MLDAHFTNELQQLLALVEVSEAQQKASARKLSRVRRRLANDLVHCKLPGKELLLKAPVRFPPLGDSVEKILAAITATIQKKP